MTTHAKDYDLVVIGSGPGGHVAALRAARHGMKTALIEQAEVGGVCLNWGCIPAKALLRSAHSFQEIGQARRLGLEIGSAAFDYAAVQQRSRQVVERLVKALMLSLKRDALDVWIGRGRLDGRDGEKLRILLEPAAHESNVPEAGVIRVREPQPLRARRVILATGVRARALPGVAYDGTHVLSSRDALALTRVPPRIVIAGAGAIGVEFADLFATFGSQVTLVEMLPQILPGMDAELGEELRKLLVRRKVRVQTGVRVEEIVRAGEGLRCRLRPAAEATGAGGAESRAADAPRANELEADKVLIAIGVVGNVETIGLETLGIRAERGFVAVDEHMRTPVPEVYAIGDLTGPPLLAHAASAHGVHAADHAAGRDPAPLARAWIPGVVYTHPQLASTGLDEAAARAKYGDVEIGRFPFVALGRAVAENETGGFVKVILARDSGRLLGAHVMSPVAGELIAELTLAGRCGLTAHDVLATVHAHPTFAEAIPGAFGAALGETTRG
jgi:dihydrolipoamide dehydrogenase